MKFSLLLGVISHNPKFKKVGSDIIGELTKFIKIGITKTFSLVLIWI